MNKEEIFSKLTQLFASIINYEGEFNSLFLIETERGELKINFLNKQHYHYIMLNLKRELLKITGTDIKFGYLNMNTSAISLKKKVQIDNIPVVKPAPVEQVKPKERVELPTIKNRTLKQVEDFMFDEYEKLVEQQKEIRGWCEEPLKNTAYISDYGEINFITKLYDWIKKNKDYDDE